MNKLIAATAFVFVLASCTADVQIEKPFDHLIVNASLITDGRQVYSTDTAIGVRQQRIAYIGPYHQNLTADNVINASGLVVAPGFIDPHTHALADLTSTPHNANLAYLAQGVTTVVIGNDGGGTTDISALKQRLESQGIGTNVASFVGHGTLRSTVIGNANRAPSPDELQHMQTLLAQAMNQGALGLSTGLYYAPGNYADTDEVVSLARIASQHGGIYDSHIRDESTYSIGVVAAVEEAIAIGESADIPVHLAHIKALGVDVWGSSTEIIDVVEAAQKRGVIVSADQYPWRASGTHLQNTLIPRWALEGNREQFLQRLEAIDSHPTLRDEMVENLRRRGGPESLLITLAPNPDFNGNTLAQIAEKLNMDVISTAILLMQQGATRVASFNMDENDIRQFMQRPWVVTSSDGTDGHPRKYASFPKKYRDYVVDNQLLSLEQFVYQSSGKTAEIFGFKQRGCLDIDCFADIVVFSPTEYQPRASFKQSDKLSKGVKHLFVNGKHAIASGQYTGELAGRFVERQ